VCSSSKSNGVLKSFRERLIQISSTKLNMTVLNQSNLQFSHV